MSLKFSDLLTPFCYEKKPSVTIFTFTVHGLELKQMC